ncbi:pyrroline-5-carboxylate reductase [Demequina aestuarii]|uniref:pyrroline-5-carboxylate reductase n=1 Tax=Demequina aestuarii TaxID=327095 RepID=UPI000780321D|nr:pyrroline-5-carboxylate reductase [Demequina aestuarii]
MSPRRRVIAVLGAGNMAGALARRWATVEPAPELRLTTGSSRPAWAQGLPHVSHVAIADTPTANVDAVAGADVVVLGVKPHAIVALANEIADALAPGTLVVSVAGGVRLADLAPVLPEGVALVRTMPNTPVAVGRGVTAFAVAAGAPEGAAARVREMFAPTGAVEALDEELIDAFSAVVGSGPAYVYAVIEALSAAAVSQGLSAEQAARMVPAMIGGAVAYLESTGRDPGDLRDEVTSPGGSTAAALGAFADHGLAEALAAGVGAATARARELGRG